MKTSSKNSLLEAEQQKTAILNVTHGERNADIKFSFNISCSLLSK